MAKRPRAKPPAKPVYVGQPAEVIYVNPLFKWVLLILLAIFVFLAVLAIYLSGRPAPTEMQKQLFTFSFNGCELIIGAIVGLLGGKSIDAFAYRRDGKPPVA